MNLWLNDQAERISLDGEWQCSLGNHEGCVQVPGSWEAQGFDRRIDGPMVMRRGITIPETWKHKRVHLQFDAVSYHVLIALNDYIVGSHTGLWTPFAFDVTDYILFGQENHLQLTIYKPGDRFPLRQTLAGFLPDVAVMFGGVWQSVKLVAFDSPALSDVMVLSDSHEVSISAQVHHTTSDEVGQITIRDEMGKVVSSKDVPITDAKIAADFSLETPDLWEPHSPTLYTATIQIGEYLTIRQKFGFRHLHHSDEQLLLNDKPIILRGILNWGWYPEILSPAPDEATIRNEFRRIKSLGFNLIKLCLYVPSSLYFDIADEEGMLLWLELPLWLPEVTPNLREQVHIEYTEILEQVHHHPSVVIYSLGCELDKSIDADLLWTLDDAVRSHCRGTLVCDNSGSGEAYGGESFDFADFNDYHFYSDLQYFDVLVDHFRRDWRTPRPWIFGEFCDADDYRDIEEIKKAYDGEIPWWLKEQNPLHPIDKIAYHEQAERMESIDIDLPHTTLSRISRQQSFVIRKTILEKVRRRTGMGGYVVTGLRDTPLATSGIFDDLNHSKYPEDAFRNFNTQSVLILERNRARDWTHGGDRPSPVEPYSFLAGNMIQFDVVLSHTGSTLNNARLIWGVRDTDNALIEEGKEKINRSLPGGRPQHLSRITFTSPISSDAESLQLEIQLMTEEQTIENSWTIWTFPEIKEWMPGIGVYDPVGNLYELDDLNENAVKFESDVEMPRVLVTSLLTEGILDYLREGGNVVLLQQGTDPLPAIAQPFWRESIKIIRDHPVTNAVPHDGFVDLQFYGLATDWALDTSKILNTLPDVTDIQPLLRRLDARLFTVSDYLIECHVGKGLLMASTLRFQGGLGDQPVGLRNHLAGRWLLYQLLKCCLNDQLKSEVI